MAKFKPKAWGTKGGSVLEATEGSNTVQIFNNYGDGKAAPLFTDSAISEMEKTTSENSKKLLLYTFLIWPMLIRI